MLSWWVAGCCRKPPWGRRQSAPWACSSWECGGARWGGPPTCFSPGRCQPGSRWRACGCWRGRAETLSPEEDKKRQVKGHIPDNRLFRNLWQQNIKRTHSEYTGDIFATGVDDIRGQYRTDRKLFIPGKQKWDWRLDIQETEMLLIDQLTTIY